MRTPEGIPIVEEGTLEEYLSQVRTGVHADPKMYRDQWMEMVREQPHLSGFIQLASQEPPQSPTEVLLFASQVYGLLKRQAQIDHLEEISK